MSKKGGPGPAVAGALMVGLALGIVVVVGVLSETEERDAWFGQAERLSVKAQHDYVHSIFSDSAWLGAEYASIKRAEAGDNNKNSIIWNKSNVPDVEEARQNIIKKVNSTVMDYLTTIEDYYSNMRASVIINTSEVRVGLDKRGIDNVTIDGNLTTYRGHPNITIKSDFNETVEIDIRYLEIFENSKNLAQNLFDKEEDLVENFFCEVKIEDEDECEEGNVDEYEEMCQEEFESSVDESIETIVEERERFNEEEIPDGMMVKSKKVNVTAWDSPQTDFDEDECVFEYTHGVYNFTTQLAVEDQETEVLRAHGWNNLTFIRTLEIDPGDEREEKIDF